MSAGADGLIKLWSVRMSGEGAGRVLKCCCLVDIVQTKLWSVRMSGEW